MTNFDNTKRKFGAIKLVFPLTYLKADLRSHTILLAGGKDIKENAIQDMIKDKKY